MTLARKPWKPGAYSTLRPKPRKPSKRSKDPVTPEVHALVFRRDGDCLLRGSSPPFDVPCAGPHQWAHRLSVEYGGPSVPSNGTRLCQLHHGRVDGAYRAEACALGLRLRRGENPSQVPVTLYDGRTVLLTDDGRQEEVL